MRVLDRDDTMKISLLMPARNEAENLPVVLDELDRVFAARDWEVLVVDDGSTDASREVLLRRRAERPDHLRVLFHAVSAGKSAALRTAAMAARGDILGTLDADGQNDPAALLQMIERLESAPPKVGLCVGQRLKRSDSGAKRWASRFANRLRQALLADATRDSACGLKAMRADVYRRLPYFDNQHRFFPALVLREGFDIIHHDVVDRPRAHGKSHYGILDRGLQGALDLFGVWWLRRRRKVVPEVTEPGA